MEAGNDHHDESYDFLTYVSKCLQNGSIEGINDFINNDKFKELVKPKSSELISLVCRELNEKNFKENSELFYCCEDFNLRIADITFPEESLLDYLEEAECEDDVKFASVLKAIEKILLRMPEKRSQTFEWVLNTIHRHILSLPLPKDYKLEPDKQKLLDCDSNVQRISEIYTVIIKFYAPFMCDAYNKFNFKNILVQSLFLLLGKPLVFMNLERDEKCTSSLRSSAKKIMYYIVQLNNDVACYIKFIGMCNFANLEPREEHLVDCDVKIEDFFTEPTKIPLLSLAVFYYLIFVEKLFLQYFSSVYNPAFILKTVGELTTNLLNLSESLCQRKGLLLLNVLLERLPQASLEYTFLDTNLHKNIVQHLATVCVYSEVKSSRKLAVEILTSETPGGQCMVTTCQLRSSYAREPPLILQDSPPQKNRTQENTHESKDQKSYEDGIKKRILEASLPFVNDLGWSKNSISAGAESLGYPGVIHGMFPRGGAELVQHFYVNCNQELTRILKEQTEKGDKSSTKEPKDLVCEAIEIRLRMITPYLSHWPQAVALMSLPPNVPTSIANLLTLVDDICYYAGDRSVDFRWYARRIALASIYKMTELYMIQDSSSEHKNTWIFLKNRISEATQLHKYLLQSESRTQMARDVASATFITARNILGLNWNR